jgi:hypothetical protein
MKRDGAKSAWSNLEDRYNRFYFWHPQELPNVQALDCNGLTDDVLREYRKA